MPTLRRREPERGSALKIILAIIGGLVVLCLLAVVVAVWVVRNYVRVEVERSGDVKKVEIHTPVGDVEVEKAADVAEKLHLPVYPGATATEDSASVRLRGRLWDEEGGLDVMAAHFRSDDGMDKVDAWYRSQLGSEYQRQRGRIEGGDWEGPHEGGLKVRVEPGGNDIVYSQETDGRTRGVALKSRLSGTEIVLFQLREAARQ